MVAACYPRPDNVIVILGCAFRTVSPAHTIINVVHCDIMYVLGCSIMLMQESMCA